MLYKHMLLHPVCVCVCVCVCVPVCIVQTPLLKLLWHF